MEPQMPNSSMRHREPKSEIDDTRMILPGASCTIAAVLASEAVESIDRSKYLEDILNLVLKYPDTHTTAVVHDSEREN
jgi:hypothetical protein